MSAKYYLDQEGLERLVDYINNGLSGKVNKGEQVVLPEDLVREADLVDYAKKSDIPEGQDLSGYAKTTDLADYALASMPLFLLLIIMLKNQLLKIMPLMPILKLLKVR